MSIRVVTDSTADLPEEVVERYGITIIPLVININGKTYRDGIDISRARFYQYLSAENAYPTTQVPPAYDFRQAYERLAQEGAREILSIHIAPALSSVLNAAMLAAQETTTAQVTVLDGRQLSLGTGYVVLRAAEAAARGDAMPQILSMLDDLIPRVRLFAMAPTATYSQRGGRMGQIRAQMSKLLSKAPLLAMANGQPASEMVWGRRRAQERLLQLVAELGPLERLDLVHTHVTDAAEDLARAAARLFPLGSEPYSVDVTPVLGAQLGPGAVGLATIQAMR